MTARKNTPHIDIDADTAFETAQDLCRTAREEVGRIILGQDRVIDLTLSALLSGGHVLLIGVPGLGKTLLVAGVSKVLGLTHSRIQCTPDLMPSDVLGSEILEENGSGKRGFRFIEGPVFTHFLMADEINRASPRTQSALLQAMQEGEVSISGKTHALPRPFHVLATQNPIEQEGTYPLPEAQLDRFLMQIDVDYPTKQAEKEMLLATTGQSRSAAETVFSPDDLGGLQHFVRGMPVPDDAIEAILKLVRRLRHPDTNPVNTEGAGAPLLWAPGPRGAQSLMLAIRAKALLDGRSAPSTDDVIDLAVPVLKHRMELSYRARADGLDKDTLIRRAAETL